MSSGLALLGALATAVCYGAGSVLQAYGARRTHQGSGLDPRLIARALREGPYVAGLALDLLGFALSLAALRGLPLFVVEAAIAANLAVIALLSVPVFGERLGAVDWAAVLAVVLGLALLAAAAAAGPADPVGDGLRWAMVALAALSVALGIPAARLPGPLAAAAGRPGLAGLAFAAVGVGARVVRDPGSPTALLHDPAALAVLLGGVGGMLLYTTALQRGSVTRATGTLVVVETAVPALIGLVWLGDRARTGWAPVAVVGFVMAVVGAVTLAGLQGRVEERRRQPVSASSQPGPATWTAVVWTLLRSPRSAVTAMTSDLAAVRAAAAVTTSSSPEASARTTWVHDASPTERACPSTTATTRTTTRVPPSGSMRVRARSVSSEASSRDVAPARSFHQPSVRSPRRWRRPPAR